VEIGGLSLARRSLYGRWIAIRIGLCLLPLALSLWGLGLPCFVMHS